MWEREAVSRMMMVTCPPCNRYLYLRDAHAKSTSHRLYSSHISQPSIPQPNPDPLQPSMMMMMVWAEKCARQTSWNQKAAWLSGSGRAGEVCESHKKSHTHIHISTYRYISKKPKKNSDSVWKSNQVIVTRFSLAAVMESRLQRQLLLNGVQALAIFTKCQCKK